MGTIKKPWPVKLFIGITYTRELDKKDILNNYVLSNFGDADLMSDCYSFDQFTEYYVQEMGKNLKKMFISFKALINPGDLPGIKRRSNQIEMEMLHDGRRLLNLDPGYLTQAKIVLATTKDYSHRIYLGEGIFGDLHMYYSNKSYHPQAWTYPDYKQEKIINYFNQLREVFVRQLAGVTIEPDDI